jgi:hypothetical protein
MLWRTLLIRLAWRCSEPGWKCAQACYDEPEGNRHQVHAFWQRKAASSEPREVRIITDCEVPLLTPDSSDKEYMVGPNFPLKQEPMAKSEFHYWERESRTYQEATVTFTVGQKESDECTYE